MALPLTGTDGPVPWGPAPTAVSPWVDGPAAPVFCPPGCPPGCHVVYGPVANVCHGAVPQLNLIPTTSVTPIPNAVYPSFGYGAPVPVGGPPFGGLPGYGGPSPLSFYGSGYGPWGPVAGGGTGWAPGIYGSDVTFLGAW